MLLYYPLQRIRVVVVVVVVVAVAVVVVFFRSGDVFHRDVIRNDDVIC